LKLIFVFYISNNAATESEAQPEQFFKTLYKRQLEVWLFAVLALFSGLSTTVQHYASQASPYRDKAVLRMRFFNKTHHMRGLEAAWYMRKDCTEN